MVDRDTTPLWRLPIGEIEYDMRDDPTDGVEIAALAENIRQCGLIHPIIVEKQPKGKKYKLISGRRRLEAVTLLGKTHISALLVKSGSLSPLQIMLSENLMRKKPHFLDTASDIEALLKQITIEEAARLFSVKEAYLRTQLRLTSLSPYEKRLIRMLSLTESDALGLCDIENGNIRKLLLEKMLEMSSSDDRSALIAQAKASPNSGILQTEKIYVRDIRMFVNSVERAAETMRNAGFDAQITRSEDEEQYTFTVRVGKQKSAARSIRRANVSRETSDKSIAGSQTCNVSRETSEIAELPIDEVIKS